MRRNDCKMDWLNLEAYILDGSAAYQKLLNIYRATQPDHPDPPSEEFMNYIACLIKKSYEDHILNIIPNNFDISLGQAAIMFCEYIFDYMWEGYGEYKKLSETLTRVVGPRLKSGTEVIGYKKAIAINPITNYFAPAIVKLRIPCDAKRSKAFGKKCRCDKAVVENICLLNGNPYKVKEAISHYDSSFVYRVGETVSVLDFDECPWKECAKGIHFFEDADDAIDYRF